MQICRAARVLLLVAGLLGATVSPSWADHTVDVLVPTANYDETCYDGSPSSTVVCRTDNPTVKYHMESSLETADESVVNSMMSNNYDETVLVVSIDTTPVFSGDSETDIVYQEDSSAIPAGSDGLYWCDDSIGTYTAIRRTCGFVQGTTARTCHATKRATPWAWSTARTLRA